MTLKNLVATLLVAATGDYFASARVVNNVCIKHTDLLGFTNQERIEYYELEGDLEKVSQMPINKLAYSRPSKITVCSDQNYVHGLMVHLQLQVQEQDAFSKKMFNAQMQAQMKNMDTMTNPESSDYYAIDMNLLGSQVAPCESFEIPKDDKIVYVQSFTDGNRLRTLHFHMASGKERSFGLDVTEDNKSGLKVQDYDFIKKVDILGVYGHVAPDENQPDVQHIVSMSFIINECPGRSLLVHERDFLDYKGMLELFEQDVDEAVHDEFIALTVLICILVGSCLVCTYFCLKNRGTICKKRSGAAPPNLPRKEPGGEEPGNVPMSAV